MTIDWPRYEDVAVLVRHDEFYRPIPNNPPPLPSRTLDRPDAILHQNALGCDLNCPNCATNSHDWHDPHLQCVCKCARPSCSEYGIVRNCPTIYETIPHRNTHWQWRDDCVCFFAIRPGFQNDSSKFSNRIPRVSNPSCTIQIGRHLGLCLVPKPVVVPCLDWAWKRTADFVVGSRIWVLVAVAPQPFLPFRSRLLPFQPWIVSSVAILFLSRHWTDVVVWNLFAWQNVVVAVVDGMCHVSSSDHHLLYQYPVAWEL
mmetsp:Transcript_16669/g.34395  ORF Transcript_16669/g.34395 Transcript_16669/m.34395 type:complete len:257 (+) Transcript_16669:254-1024(+)